MQISIQEKITDIVFSPRYYSNMISTSLSKGIFFILFLFTPTFFFAASPYEKESSIAMSIVKESFLIDSLANSIYTDLNTEELSYPVFLSAFNGYYAYQKSGLIENKNILTIIDFDKTSDQERFFIVDLEKHEVLLKSLVAHGQKTGELEAENFSNREESHKSSLGFYLTDNTYFGKHGLSLRLDGLTQGLNDNARKRNIVVHSADYVSEEFIAKNKRLGRSWGCPALPADGYEDVIELIKEKSLLFVYSSKANFVRQSRIY